jgi:hypothetical protein
MRLAKDTDNPGLRSYSPRLGRWISRDPIGEWGSRNLYSCLDNDGVNDSDFLGMARALHVKPVGKEANWKRTVAQRAELRTYTFEHGAREVGEPCDTCYAHVYLGPANSLVEKTIFRVAAGVLIRKYNSKGYETVVFENASKQSFINSAGASCVAQLAFIGHGGTSDMPGLSFSVSDDNEFLSPDEVDPDEMNGCFSGAALFACNSGREMSVRVNPDRPGSFDEAFRGGSNLTVDQYLSDLQLVLGWVQGFEPTDRPACCGK